MKPLIRFASCLILIANLSCSSSEFMVESDYSYDARFHRYKTFKFASNDNFIGSVEDRALFEKYVGSMLSAWGYRPHVKRPDFYVFYTLYYDDLTMKGYHQPELQRWSGLSNRYLDQVQSLDSLSTASATDSTTERQRRSKEDYSPVSFDMREGTILISFFDRRKGKTVWQGYASGVFGYDKVKNERTLRSAIIKIMDQFKLPSFQS